MAKAQIIAIGGGGFTEGLDPALDQYVLDQSVSKTPSIGFVATASGDADAYLLKFYRRFGQLAAEAGLRSLAFRQLRLVTPRHS